MEGHGRHLSSALMLLLWTFTSWTPSAAMAPSLSCPADWTLNADKCYKLFSVKLNHPDAVQACQSYGSHLVSVLGYTENKLIGDLVYFEHGDVRRYWIGNFDDINADVAAAIGFWDNSQPDISEGSCAYVDIAANSSVYMYPWTLGPCHIKRPFVCVKKACPADHFECANGKCVKSDYKCDGLDECGDNSDELDCGVSSGDIGNTYLQNPSGTITSSYEADASYQWTIETAVGTQVKLTFNSFNTELNTDEVQIWVGNKTKETSILIKRLSGPLAVSSLKPFYSHNNFMIVFFVTDHTTALSGFTANYETVTQPGDEELMAWDRIGHLQSPDFPNGLLSSIRQTWIITAARTLNLITLQSVEIDLGPDAHVDIRDGSEESALLLAKYEGSSGPQVVISTGPSMVVYLHTTSQHNGRGFHFTYMQGCSASMTADYGTFTSPGYGVTRYANRQTCTYRISSPGGVPLKVVFNKKFRLQENKDFLRVYRGTDDAAPELDQSPFTGVIAPLPITSDDGSLFFKFESSAIINEDGFSVSFGIDCPSPNFNSNTRHGPIALTLGDQIDVTCPEGYYFGQEEHKDKLLVTITCIAGGWDVSLIPQCEPVFCGQAPLVPNSYYKSFTEPNMRYGGKVTYECFGGYSIVGSDFIVCQKEGTWSPHPTCKGATCNPLPGVSSPLRMIKQDSSMQYGDIVQYECADGYMIDGEPLLICGSDGWSASPPSCQKLKCAVPYIEHATLSKTTRLDFEDSLTVNCDVGYVLVAGGDPVMRCLEDQTFDSWPMCENVNECEDNLDDCDGDCIDTDGSFYCSCGEGYDLAEDGKKCNDIDECEPNGGIGPCSPGDVFGSCVNSVGSYRCVCNEGFVLFTEDGTSGYDIPFGETGMQPGDIFRINHTCVPQSCPADEVLDLANGQLLTTRGSFRFMEYVDFICDLGFVLKGADRLTCLAEGVWSGSKPICETAICPIPSTAGLDYPPEFRLTDDSVIDLNSIRSIAYGETIVLYCEQHRPQPIRLYRMCVYDMATNTYKFDLDDELECPIIDCGIIPLASGANYDPTAQLTVYGTRVDFECKPTYTLKGVSSSNDNVVRCLESGRWDFNSLACAGLSCQDPGTPPGATQNATRYTEGAQVTFNCIKDGFQVDDPTPLTCVAGNPVPTWDRTTLPSCVDNEPPVIQNCPADVAIDKLTVPGFPVPMPTDNSAVKTFTVDPEYFSPDQTLTSNLIVTYRAEDYAGLSSECVVSIRIKDDELPVITCPGPVEQLIDMPEDKIMVTSGGATATDNDGEPVITYNPPMMEVTAEDIGSNFIIEATARDSDGNMESCRYMVTVKAALCKEWGLRTPVNGMKTCTPDGTGFSCEMSCNTNFYFYDNPGGTLTYTCSAGSDWSPKNTVPDCVEPVDKAIFEQTQELVYSAMEDISGGSCTDYYASKFDEKIMSVYPSLNAMCQLANEGVNYDLGPNRAGGDSTTRVTMNGREISIQFPILYGPNTLTKGHVSLCSGFVTLAFEHGSSRIEDLQELPGNSNCPALSYSLGRANVVDSSYMCQERYKNVDQPSQVVCIPCPPGTRQTGGSCEECDFGQYQNQPDQDSCIPCPALKWTRATGSLDKMQCLDTCEKAQMVSDNRLAPCRSCPKDTYASSSTECTTCPLGTATLETGASSEADCKDACQPGQYSLTGFGNCTKCPMHFYQDGAKATTCKECSDSQLTLTNGAANSAACMDAETERCTASTCQNGGTCIISNHREFCTCAEGYTGKTCETEINFCDSNPCFHGATCLGELNGYTCTCPGPEYTGDHCENEPEDCPATESEQCMNNGMCQDVVDGFNCLCLEGFSGDRCQITESLCMTNPCLNDAECENIDNVRRICTCKDGWTGDDCSENIDDCASNPCLYDGECVDEVDDYSCECWPGYSGKNCEMRPEVCGSSNPCSSSGMCVDNYRDGNALCVCEAGFEPASENNGTWYSEIFAISQGACEAINFCDLYMPCQNGGSCTPSSIDYTCTCPNGFDGHECQHNIEECESDPCQNGGTCEDLVNGYKCHCVEGYDGTTCRSNINDCGPANPCDPMGRDNNHPEGTKGCKDLVNDYECFCKEGYGGKNCGENLDDCMDPNPCMNGGTCNDELGGYTCDCAEGWTGDRCDVLLQLCDNNPCLNAESCNNIFNSYFCKCRDMYYGVNCSSKASTCDDATPCVEDNGVCMEKEGKATCHCAPGFTGDGCEIASNLCGSQEDPVCQNGGKCTSAMGSFTCHCTEDYTGQYCEMRMNDCQTSHCDGIGEAVCLDGINEAVCDCPVETGKAGKDCQKELYTDYDFNFYSASKTGYTFLAYPFAMGSDGLSVGLWVRFDEEAGEGVFFSLFGTIDRDPRSTRTEILTLDHQYITLSFGASSFKIPISPSRINDRQWYHIIVGWEKETGTVLVVINSVKRRNVQPYSAGAELPEYGWIVLGSKYDAATGNPVEGAGFNGAITQVNVWKKMLSFQTEIPPMVGDSQHVIEDDLIKRFGNYLLHSGVRMSQPSNARQRICEVGKIGAMCDQEAPDKTAPSITCPDTLFLTNSERLTQMTWDEPSTVGASTKPVSLLLQGAVEIWGKYTNIYYATDDAGNAAVCSFDIYIRKEDCNTPPDPTGGGSQTCDTQVQPFRKCEPTCPDTKTFSQPAPKWFTCGPLGTFNYQNHQLPIKYPSCSAITIGKVDIEILVIYNSIEACDSVIIAKGFTNPIREKMASLNSKWGLSQSNPKGGLCAQIDCSDIDVKVICSNSGGARTRRATSDATASISLQGVQTPLFDKDGNELSPDDILLEGAVDNGILDLQDTVPNGNPDLDNLVIEVIPVCDPGQGLDTDNQCVDCGSGQFYDTQSTSCKSCPVGYYQDQAKQSSCNPCEDGKTTQLEGTESEAGCIESCMSGYYHDGNSCKQCEVGYYQPLPGQFFCHPCEGQKTTPSEGSTSANQCKDVCPDGTQLAMDGNCKECPRGQYRTAGVHDQCISCPAEFTTQNPRSREESQCTVPNCNAGYYIDGDKCSACPKGQYQPSTVQPSCIPCDPSFTTISEASKSLSDCKFICEMGFEEMPNALEQCKPCDVGSYKDNRDPGGKCQECANGYTTPSTGSIGTFNCSFKDCEAGEQPVGDGCEPCPRSTYQPEPHKEKCMQCEPSYSTLDTGAQDPLDCMEYCPNGQYMNKTSTQCEPCPQGTYRNNTEYEYGECKTCPAAFITASEGAGSKQDCNIANCRAGSYRDPTENVCKPCQLGFYQEEKWQESCIQCTGGKTTPGLGTVLEKDCRLECDAGKEDIGGVCQLCEIGEYKSDPGATECTPCPSPYITESEGSTTVSDCNVEDCEAGEFLQQDKTCAVCREGFYQDKQRMSECKECPLDPNGKPRTTATTMKEGHDNVDDCILNCDDGQGYNYTSEVCEPCAIGYYRKKGIEDLCTLCPIDKITKSVGTVLQTDCNLANCSAGYKRITDPDNILINSCEECPRGTFQPMKWQDSCMSCPADRSTTIHSASTNVNDCKIKCPSGYQLSYKNQCEECPRGKFRTGDDTFYCKDCPSGKTTLGTGAKSESECNIVYCEPGSYVVGTSCRPCPEGNFQPDVSRTSCFSCPPNRPRTWMPGAVNESQCLVTTSCANASLDCGSRDEGKVCIGLECACRIGWVGDYPGCTHVCDLTDYCSNGGTCDRSDLEAPSCKCTENWTGPKCLARAEKQSMTPFIIGGSIGGALFLLLMFLCLMFVCIGPVGSRKPPVPHTNLVNPGYAQLPYMNSPSKDHTGPLAGSLGRSMNSLTNRGQTGGLYGNNTIGQSIAGYSHNPESKYLYYEENDNTPPVQLGSVVNYPVNNGYSNGGFSRVNDYEEKTSVIHFLEEEPTGFFQQASPLDGTARIQNEDPYSTLDGAHR